MTDREFGSEYDEIILSDGYFWKLTKSFISSAYVRSGREAIGVVIDSVVSDTKKVLMPAYICPSVIEPFLIRGWEVVYYKLNIDLTVDEGALYVSLAEEKYDIIMLVNYFGIIDNIDDISIKIKNKYKDISVLYDFTHICLTLHSYPKVDYYVASVRKWFGISDGAVVLSNNKLEYCESKPTELSGNIFINAEKALINKREYLLMPNQKTKSEYKNEIKYVRENLDSSVIYPMSKINLERIYSLNAEQIFRKRNINLLHLWDNIKDIDGVTSLISDRKNLCNSYFTLPLLLDDHCSMQYELADLNIYCQVIWTIPEKAGLICRNSASISKKVLCIPVDQRLNYWDIEEISKRIKLIFK